MDYAYPNPLQSSNFGGAWPNHVRSNQAVAKKSNSVEIINRTCSFGFEAIINFSFRFGNVHHNWRARAIRKGARSFEMCFGNRVRSMWGNGRNNQLVSFPVLYKLLHISHCLGVGLVVG